MGPRVLIIGIWYKRLRTMAALSCLSVGLAAPIFLRTEATAEDVL